MTWSRQPLTSVATSTVGPLESEDSKLPDVGFGEIAKVKEIFPDDKLGCSCCPPWVDNRRGNTEQRCQARKESDKYAIVCHYERTETGSYQSSKISVQNKAILNALAFVFEDSPAFDAKSGVAEFSRPFTPLIHHWKSLLQMEADEKDSASRKLLRLFRDFLEKEMKDVVRAWELFQTTGFTSYQTLPLLLIPGEIVVSRDKGATNAGVIVSVEEVQNTPWKNKKLQIKVAQTVWDGSKWCSLVSDWNIDKFLNTKHLSTFWVTPLKHLKEGSMLRRDLVRRGRKYESMRGQHYKQYDGRAHFLSQHKHDDVDRPKSRQISERVVIDTRGYYEVEEATVPESHPLRCLKDVEEAAHRTARTAPIKNFDPRGYEHHYQVSSEDCSQGWAREKAVMSLTDDECLVAVSHVYGFAIETKAWCELDIDLVQDIEWASDAMSHLVIGNMEKRLVSETVAAHQSGAVEGFGDFVAKKGTGLITLLCGPPGTGKTFTAEAVAESLRRPLYRVSASDLRITCEDMDSRLKLHLDRCALIKGVLLIDEADVFLEARSSENLQRNELVATFLRLLEYYEGVMFLTTNRMVSIDPAFESRVDITLTFPDLDEGAREQIWRKFLGAEGSNCDLGDDAYAMLAMVPLNGRQIKSAAKTARIMAAGDKAPINMDHLRVVVDLRTKAAKNLGSCSGQ